MKMARRGTGLALAALVAVALLAFTACGGGGEGTVKVTLQEFEVAPDTSSIEAGDVTFEATNNGPEDPHELVVIKTDLAPDALPTTDEGAVDEAGAGIQVIGEIEEFDVGQTQSATFNLEPGNYVLICNVVETHEGELEAHYSLGMRTAFTVEA